MTESETIMLVDGSHRTFELSRRFQASLEKTRALREGCAAIFLPLFEHCISLALDSYGHGHAQQAGIELLHARKVAHYMLCGCGRPAIRGSSFCSAHNGTCWRVYDNGGKTTDRYTVCIDDGNERWEGQTRFVTCLGLSEGGRAVSMFSEAQEGRHLGKRVKLESLDAATRAHIVSRLQWTPND